MDQNKNNKGNDSSKRSSGGNSPNSNLSHEDRVKGGEASAQSQDRDEDGQFAGKSGSTGSSDSKRTSSGGTSGSNSGGYKKSDSGSNR